MEKGVENGKLMLVGMLVGVEIRVFASKSQLFLARPQVLGKDKKAGWSPRFAAFAPFLPILCTCGPAKFRSSEIFKPGH
jgi:hypothetical protein